MKREYYDKNAMNSICALIILVFAGIANSAPIITGWSSSGGTTQNKDNAQDIMYLVQQGDTITFSVNATGADNYQWLVNKIDQNRNANSFTFNVPVCDHLNDPPSCIWEIHVTANDSSGNEAHNEWVVSNLTFSEAPSLFDSFSDAKWQNRTDTDPWGRPLPEWTKNSNYIYFVDVTHMAINFNVSALAAYNNILLLANHTVKRGTWVLKYQLTPEGSPGWSERVAYNIRPITGAITSSTSSPNFGITKAFEPQDHTWPSYSVGDNSYLSSGYPGVGGWGIGSNGYGSGAWKDLKFIRTSDNRISMWTSVDESSTFTRNNDHLDNTLMDDSLLNGRSDNYSNSNYIGIITDRDNTNAPYKVYLDDVQIYANKYVLPANISYGNYVDRYDWDYTPPQGWVEVNRIGIIIDGLNVTLSDIYQSLNNASLFSYDYGNRTAVLYTDLDISPGAGLIISNETLRVNSNSNGEHKIRVKSDATLVIKNSRIMSDNNYSYNWSFPSEWRPSAYSGSYTVNFNGRFILENSIIENSGGLYLAGASDIILENSAFRQLMPVSQQPMNAGGVYARWQGESSPSHALSFRFRREISNFRVKNMNISFNAPTDMYFLSTDPWMGNGSSIFDPQLHGATLQDTVLENVSVHAKKALLYYWTWYHPTTLNLVNTKFVNSNVTVDTDNALIFNKYYLDSNVVDRTGSPLPNITVIPVNEIDSTVVPSNTEEYRVFAAERSYGDGAVGGWDPISRKKPAYGRDIYSTSTDASGHTPPPNDSINTLVLTASKVSGEFAILTYNSTRIDLLFYLGLLNGGLNNVLLINASNYYLSGIGHPTLVNFSAPASYADNKMNIGVSLMLSSPITMGNVYNLTITNLPYSTGSIYIDNLNVSFNYSSNGQMALVYRNTTNYTYGLSVYDPNNIWTNITHAIYPNGTIQQLQPLARVTGVNPDTSWYRPNPNDPTYTVNLTISYIKTNLKIKVTNTTNIKVNEYSSVRINFTATNITSNQKMNLTIGNGAFPVINGNQYIIKKNGILQTTQTASSGQVLFANIGVGSEYIIQSTNGVMVSLLSPANTSFTDNATITFNCSALTINNLVNITLYGNWSNWHANETVNLGGLSNSTTFTKTLSNGTYKWNCLAYDNSGNFSFAANNYTFAIDTSPITTTTTTTTSIISTSTSYSTTSLTTTSSTSTISTTTTTSTTSTTSTTISISTTSTTTASTSTTGATSTTTSTTLPLCTVKGDLPPCDCLIEDWELLDYINKWAKGLVPDFDLLSAIRNWSEGVPAC